MGKFRDEPTNQVNNNQDGFSVQDSYCTDRSDEVFHGVAEILCPQFLSSSSIISETSIPSSQAMSSPNIPVKSSRRPLSRGRVHNYSCRGQGGLTSREMDDSRVDFVVHGQAMLTKSLKIVTAEPVQSKLSDLVTKIRRDVPPCVRERAKISPSPTRCASTDTSSTVATTTSSHQAVTIERASLASLNCPET